LFASKARYGQGPAAAGVVRWASAMGCGNGVCCNEVWLGGFPECPNGARHTSPG
jgi:hypothetical protein